MKKKKTKKVVWKTPEFYFALLFSVITIVFIFQLFKVNILPTKYIVTIVVILSILAVGLNYLQLGKKVNKVNKILGKVLIVLLGAVLVIGNVYLFETDSTFGKITGDNTSTTVISVIVKKENKASKLSDIADSKFGHMKNAKQDDLGKTISDLEKDLKKSLDDLTYESYKDFGNDFYDGKFEVLILDEGSRGLIKDNHSNFDNETKIIKQYEYTKKSEDISKSVNVTNEAFNVYITGIDSYGGISTVSRSDVNMIASINPKTKQILLTSIPRDYYLPQPCQGNQKDKLTHSGIFGVECTIGTVENYFKAEINYYARVNFSSLVDIVDGIGGITVDNPVAFTGIDGNIPFSAGTINLNGREALSFSRERYSFSDGDRERGKNQMRVITGIINKLVSPSIIKNYTSVMSALGGSFQTNMSNSEMTSLIKMQIDDMAGWSIEQTSVSGTGNPSAWSPANGFNSWVMEPDKQTVDNAVNLIEKLHQGEDIKPLVKSVNE